jgi:hypothetical protein
LGVGAVISGLLVPYITSQWQNHEKELELKTTLVSRLSESVSKTLTAAQFTNAELPEAVDYYLSYYEWETASSAIGSYLRAYFPNARIGEEWDEYANITTSFLRLSAVNPLHEKEQLVGQLKEYFSSCPSDINWNALIDPNDLFFRNPEYRYNWFLVREQIISSKNNIAQEVLELPIFTSNPFWQSANNFDTKEDMLNKLRC